MTRDQIIAKMQQITTDRDTVAQQYQDQINVLLKAAHLYVSSQNAHLETLRQQIDALVKDEPDEPAS